MMEKRRVDRTATDIVGRLVSDNLNIPCTILDVSANGARLQVQPGLFLPKQMFLRSREIGADRTVQVVWRNKTQLGVRF